MKRGVALYQPRIRKPVGSGYIGKNGYKKIRRKGGHFLEHRLIMERKLGRKLLPGESVHHKNGVRHDNRDENLELRVAAHPIGLSAAESIRWAQEILRRYT